MGGKEADKGNKVKEEGGCGHNQHNGTFLIFHVVKV
jgi:hypothetical protein